MEGVWFCPTYEQRKEYCISCNIQTITIIINKVINVNCFFRQDSYVRQRSIFDTRVLMKNFAISLFNNTDIATLFESMPDVGSE